MELKVWVDGIQRVVCGANYSTTCQDVVLALAHAMGRTGRFTLVEKWRDTERPLTPGECPLQALHKWGEYSGEVKFYLVQADTEKVRQKSQSNWHDKSAQKMDNFSHNFSPTSQQQRPSVQPMSESIKRSSTFSGVHGPNYVGPPSSQSLSLGTNQTKLQQPHQNQRHLPPRQSSSQHQYQNQLQTLSEHVPSKSRSSSQSRQQERQQHLSASSIPSSLHSRHHLQNGNISTMSSSSSDNSSPRLSSQSPSRKPMPHIPTQPSLSVSNTQSTESRHLHPANMPGAHDERTGRSMDRSHQRGRRTTSQHSQQYQDHLPSQPPASHPTPAPRSHHRHRASPASPTSQQYENLPPARPSREKLPPGQSSSTFQVPRPRRSTSSGRRSSNDEQSSQHNNTHPSRENNFFVEKPETTRRDAPEGNPEFLNLRASPRKDIASIHNAGNFPPGYFPKGEVSISQSDQAAGAHRNFQNVPSRGFPSNDINSRPISGDSLKPKPSQGLPVKSASQRTSDSQPLLKSPTSAPSMNTLERTRRSQGDKVSFVESAFLRQQRSGKDIQNPTSSFSTSPRQHNIAQDDTRYQRRENTSNHHPDAKANTESRFPGQSGYDYQSSPNNSTSSQQSPLPSFSNAQPQFQDPEHPPMSQTNNLLSSPRRHSAFKEVSPRSSRPSSLSSPAGEPIGNPLVAYNLDNQNFDHYPGPYSKASGPIQEPNALRPHSRQASLEIEEYDLDQNFPDVFSAMRGASSNGNGSSQTHMEYVMDRQGTSTSDMEPEYMHLLRKVNMQQERLKMIEAQTDEISTEIDSLEVEESNLDGELEVVLSELKSLGQKEEAYHLELDDLERVEWVNVVDGELKCEQDLKKQMSSLKDGLSTLEMQLEDLKKDETAKLEENEQEQEEVERGKVKEEQEEENRQAEIRRVENALSESEDILVKREEELSDLLKQIADMEKLFKDQEMEATELESELHDENMKDFQAHPVPKESVPPSISSITDLMETQPPASPSTPSSDTGEAILKILEEGRSPRISPAMDESGGGISSAQHLYKSALAAKNPNGIWV